jgi:uncharacterized membrane protein YgcG
MLSRLGTVSHGRSHLAVGLIAVLAGLLFVVVAAMPAGATPPFALPGQVTDQVGAVEGHTAGISAAIHRLETEHGIRIWVVFVDTFDGMDPQQWADATFAATGLGVDDYLLAVAMTDRQYGYVVDQDFVLDDAALARVATAAERHLAENPARAVVEAAGAIDEEFADVTGPAPAPRRASEESHEIPEGILFALAVGVIILATVAKGIRRVRQGLPFFEPQSGRSDDTWSSQDSWSSSSGISGGGGAGGGDTRGGSGSF